MDNNKTIFVAEISATIATIIVSAGLLIIYRAGRKYDYRRFDLGYCGINEHKKQIFAKMKSIKRLESGKNTDLAIDAPVYDIEFDKIEYAKGG